MKKMHSDHWLGLFSIAFALLLIFVWIPLDIETGIIEKVRRRLTIGDSLAPTIAGCVLILGGALTFLKPTNQASTLSRENGVWLASLLTIFAISFLLMRYLGPALASLLTDTGYRPLRNTVPWKYIGYICGGAALIVGMGFAVTGRLGRSHFIVGFTAAIAIALAYDLPFEDLLLPPNGDM